MDDQLPDLPILRTLPPPAGGLERLRVALDREERRSARRPWLFAAATVAAAVLCLVLLERAGPRPASRAESGPDMVRDPTVVSSESVAFYWSASTAIPEELIERSPGPPSSAIPLRGDIPLATFGPPPTIRP